MFVVAIVRLMRWKGCRMWSFLEVSRSDWGWMSLYFKEEMRPQLLSSVARGGKYVENMTTPEK